MSYPGCLVLPPKSEFEPGDRRGAADLAREREIPRGEQVWDVVDDLHRAETDARVEIAFERRVPWTTVHRLGNHTAGRAS